MTTEAAPVSGIGAVRMPVKVVCPRCEQGWVTDQVVVETGDRWRVCEECDAVWHVLAPVRAPGSRPCRRCCGSGD